MDIVSDAVGGSKGMELGTLLVGKEVDSSLLVGSSLGVDEGMVGLGENPL